MYITENASTIYDLCRIDSTFTDVEAKEIANILANNDFKKIKKTKEYEGGTEKKIAITDISLTPAHIAELADALEDGKITSKQGKEVFAEMLETNKMPSVIIKEKGMEVVSDAGEIDKIVQDVIAANPKAIEDWKGGKTNVVGWLMGQVMKQSHGKANPKQATELLNKHLAAL